MTPGQRAVLQQLADHEHTDRGEIVCDGLHCYMGYRRVHWKTINALVDMVAITNGAVNGESVKRWVINETGKQHLLYPGLEDKLLVALRAKDRGGFRIERGEIVYMDPNPAATLPGRRPGRRLNRRPPVRSPRRSA